MRGGTGCGTRREVIGARKSSLLVPPLVPRPYASTPSSFRSIHHRNLHSLRPRRLACDLVSCIRMPSHADAGVVSQHAIEAQAHLRRAVGNDDLTGVQGVADADAAAMVE